MAKLSLAELKTAAASYCDSTKIAVNILLKVILKEYFKMYITQYILKYY